MLLNNKLVNKEIKGEIKKIPWDKQKQKYNISNLWGTAKAVLTAKFTMIQAYLRNKKNLKQTILTLHLKKLREKKNKQNPKVSRRKKLKKIRNKWNRN